MGNGVNPDLTKQVIEVLFSCKKSSPNHPQLIFNGIAVAKSNDQKHLGLVLGSRLSFDKHLNEKIMKAKKNGGILNHLSKFSPLRHGNKCTKLLFVPILITVILFTINHLDQNHQGVTLSSSMEEVERVRYQAALAISGAWRGSSCSKLYEELGWESLSDRRMCRRILQIHKICNNKTPNLNDLLTPNSGALFSGNTHNTFREIICKSNKYTFPRMRPLPEISSSNILRFNLSLVLTSQYFFALKPRIYLVYMILWATDISFN